MQMRVVTSLFTLSALGLFAIGFTGYTADAKKNEPSVAEQARAQSGAPVSAQVDVVKIPADPNLPKYVVAILKPFDYSASGQTSGGGQDTPSGTISVDSEMVTTVGSDGTVVSRASETAGPGIGKGISAQLRTVLSGWPNIVIVPPDTVKKNEDGTYSCKLQPGEIGPFVIEGTVTEFSETAQASGKGNKVSTRKVGRLVRDIGFITGNTGVAIGGDAAALVGPEFKNESMNRTGMVGMDLAIIDGRTARYVGNGTFSCQGSFSTVSKASNVSILFVDSGKGEMAASSLGQATRAAMNDALEKIHDALAGVR